MKTKQLNGYKIEFYSKEEIIRTSHCGDECDGTPILFFHQAGIGLHNLYTGKVEDISEELAEKIVEYSDEHADEYWRVYKDYREKEHPYITDIQFAKQSFQTLSELEYCIINKI